MRFYYLTNKCNQFLLLLFLFLSPPVIFLCLLLILPWVKTRATIHLWGTQESVSLSAQIQRSGCLAWTDPIFVFLPLGAPLFSVRTCHRESAGAAIEGIHFPLTPLSSLMLSMGGRVNSGFPRIQVRLLATKLKVEGGEGGTAGQKKVGGAYTC